MDLSQELKEQLTFLEPQLQDQQRSAPKRSSRAADNDSASNIIPRLDTVRQISGRWEMEQIAASLGRPAGLS